jgi:hypothetical protein
MVCKSTILAHDRVSRSRPRRRQRQREPQGKRLIARCSSRQPRASSSGRRDQDHPTTRSTRSLRAETAAVPKPSKKGPVHWRSSRSSTIYQPVPVRRVPVPVTSRPRTGFGDPGPSPPEQGVHAEGAVLFKDRCHHRDAMNPPSVAQVILEVEEERPGPARGSCFCVRLRKTVTASCYDHAEGTRSRDRIARDISQLNIAAGPHAARGALLRRGDAGVSLRPTARHGRGTHDRGRPTRRICHSADSERPSKGVTINS